MLAQVVSSSSCKRSWSSYSFVHNKSRNRLNAKRAEDLVYVYTNSKILAGMPEKKGFAEQQWYEQNRLVEDSDSEGPRNSDYEVSGNSAAHMEAFVDLEVDVEGELLAGNDLYDNDDYELQNWCDRNFPDRSRHRDGDIDPFE